MKNPPPPIQFGQRAERAGRWHKAEQGDWVFGSIVAFGGETLTVKDNNGRDHVISQKRVSWKPSLQCWAIWAPWVGHAVLSMEENERRADQLGVGRLRTYPMMGDYVVVHRGDASSAGFIRRLSGDALEVTQRTPDAKGRFYVGVNKAHMHWDDEHGFWRARSGAPQEKR